jgi:energy-converting hydrogenase Eha subunit C
MEIELILTSVSLFGMACVARHEIRFIGFIICSIGNIGWIIHGNFINNISYIVLFSGYLIFNIIGAFDAHKQVMNISECIK